MHRAIVADASLLHQTTTARACTVPITCHLPLKHARSTLPILAGAACSRLHLPGSRPSDTERAPVRTETRFSQTRLSTTHAFARSR